MKVKVKLYRGVEIQTNIAKGALGLDADAIAQKCEMEMLDQFGPLAPRIKIIWPDSGAIKTLAVAEMIAFDIPRAEVPASGVVLGDPMLQNEVAEAEGALRSELARYGIFIEPDQQFEWRLWYELEGNSMLRPTRVMVKIKYVATQGQSLAEDNLECWKVELDDFLETLNDGEGAFLALEGIDGPAYYRRDNIVSVMVEDQ